MISRTGVRARVEAKKKIKHLQKEAKDTNNDNANCRIIDGCIGFRYYYYYDADYYYYFFSYFILSYAYYKVLPFYSVCKPSRNHQSFNFSATQWCPVKITQHKGHTKHHYVVLPSEPFFIFSIDPTWTIS